MIMEIYVKILVWFSIGCLLIWYELYLIPFYLGWCCNQTTSFGTWLMLGDPIAFFGGMRSCSWVSLDDTYKNSPSWLVVIDGGLSNTQVNGESLNNSRVESHDERVPEWTSYKDVKMYLSGVSSYKFCVT